RQPGLRRPAAAPPRRCASCRSARLLAPHSYAAARPLAGRRLKRTHQLLARLTSFCRSRDAGVLHVVDSPFLLVRAVLYASADVPPFVVVERANLKAILWPFAQVGAHHHLCSVELADF
ncbi:unnamed protein product, partial [Phaeothamnion confervicola]